jgi:hypothetical protein
LPFAGIESRIAMPASLFRPPHVEITPELRWLLLRAFGPPGMPAPGPVDGGEAFRLARTYRLAQRLVARTDRETLVGELGSDAALRLVSLQTLGEARGTALARALPHVAEAAAAAGTPVVLLKFAALLACGVVSPAGRGAADLDVLVEPAGGLALHRELIAAGFAPAPDGDPNPRAHLPQLVDGSGQVRVEVHTFLLGIVSARGTTPTVLGDLAGTAALRAVPELPGACFVPARELMVAQVLVHGMVQHGFSPRSYPPFKMLADLLDLGIAGEGGRELLSGACQWLPANRWRIDVDAIDELCRALSRGDLAPLDSMPAGRRARRYLDHCLAGPVDSSYRRRLKLRRVFFTGALRGRWRTVGRALRSAVYLSRREIDAHYGAPKSAWGYLGYRVVWPLDVFFRKLPSALRGLLGLTSRRPR